jgi:ParB family transcriptional regulator, chromosome partitioning protein
MTAAPKKKPSLAGKEASGKLKKSSLGLDSMGDLSALLDMPIAAANGGGPLLLDMDLIDEDPHQPRTEKNPGFSKESLSELAASIKLRGVKTPISVRDHLDIPGRYIINHGARRFRGSRQADKTTIPGFIDNDYNEADQVVENLQRNELTAREIADYIGRELAKGVKKGDIARQISKSPAFVSQHVTLLDLPDTIAHAFNSGRVKDVTVINELVTAYKKKPQEITDWLGDEDQEITRGSVTELRGFLDGKQWQEEDGEQDEFGANGDEIGIADPKKKRGKPADPEKLKKSIVQVQHNKRSARLMLNRRSPAKGYAWLKYDDDGHELKVNLSSVTLIAVVEG